MESFVTGLIGFALFFLLAITILRLDIARPAPVLQLCACAGIAFPLAVAGAVIAGARVHFWEAGAVYAFPFMGFMFFFSAFYKSLSIRMIHDLRLRDGHSAPSAQLFDDYIRGESFPRRIELMVAGGMVERTPDGLVLTEAGRRNAGRLVGLQRLFGIESSG